MIARMEIRRLIVFIPGIGGSVLSDLETGAAVWSHGKRTLTRALWHPETLDLSRDLRPTGLLQDVQALPGWTVLQGYTKIWNRLAELPGATADDATGPERNPRANVIAFPYDFRRSIRDSAAALDKCVRDQLTGLDRTDEPNSVIVVAHSMGGLVARYWIAQLGGNALCHGLITLGTPHRGAPKALDVFANDLRGPKALASKRIRGLSDQLRSWDSVAELLPRYPCIQDPTSPGTGIYIHDLGRFGEDWHELATAGKHGWEFHQEIETGWAALHTRPKFRARSGIVQPTLQSATITGSRIEVTRLAPVWCDLGIFAQDEGDGTVPAISAFPIEVEDEGTYADTVANLPVTHGRIGNDEAAVGFVKIWEGFPTKTAARGRERHPGLGVDVPDIIGVGTTATVRVSIRGVELDNPAAQPVYISASPAGGATAGRDPRAGTENVRAEWDAKDCAYVVELPPLPSGYWSVSARANSVPRAGTLHTDRDIAVVDMDENQ